METKISEMITEQLIITPETKLKKQPSILRIKDLNVYAGNHHILKNIDLEIPRNKITVLLGPSGCGKTTLLKSINKLTDLYRELKVSGQIYIEKDDILNTNKNIPLIRLKNGAIIPKTISFTNFHI
jgi:phosphate transport system ATP-binding protein